MVFIFSTPVLIRHLWQLKTVVFLHWRLICAALLSHDSVIITLWTSNNQHIIILQSTYDILTIISRSPYNHSMIIYTLWSSYNYLTVILELSYDHLTIISAHYLVWTILQSSFASLVIILQHNHHSKNLISSYDNLLIISWSQH